MSVRLLSIGLATPPGTFSQERSVQFASRLAAAHVKPSVLEALHRRTAIRTRGSMLLDAATGLPGLYPDCPGSPSPTTQTRLSHYTRHATTLGLAAARDALHRCGMPPERITHLITVSCTGFEAPGFDQSLVHGLPLNRSVRRTHIGFMGCHGAVNALAVADSIVRAHPGAVVMVGCVELCSLHMHYTDRADQLVANALFADGAAAAILGASDDTSLPEPVAFAGALFEGSADDMTWRIGDHGFEMTLASRVPELLKQQVPAWVDALLDSAQTRRRDVRGWAIHPGGPRIVQAVTGALGLEACAADDSLAVLAAHGNMSSPTVLFILRRLWDRRQARPWVAMAFGPGLAAEGFVVR